MTASKFGHMPLWLAVVPMPAHGKLGANGMEFAAPTHCMGIIYAVTCALHIGRLQLRRSTLCMQT